MKDETIYTEQSNTLDTLGIAYQRLRSSSKKVDIKITHTDVELLLLRKIHTILKSGLTIDCPNEVLDTLGKLYQRVASLNNNSMGYYEGKGGPALYQRVLKLIEEIIAEVL